MAPGAETSPAAVPATPASLPRASALPAAVVAVAALYVHFLIFGEFAFLEVVRSAVPAQALTPVLGALGLGGIAGSVLGAAVFRARHGRWMAAVGYAGCALSAFWSLHLDSLVSSVLAAAASGLALGVATVSVALCLRPTTHLRRLGLTCGLGTGLAYAVCNLPVVFSAPPRTQVWVALAASVTGLLATAGLRSYPHHHSDAADYRPRVIGIWVLIFLTLVWLDSAAFYVIQHTEPLKASTWQGTLALLGNAVIHLLAAVLAGVALDRRRFTPTTAAAAVCLVTACLILAGAAQRAPLARVLYMAGVSLYSTALVYFPARSGRRWVAAALYAVAGWIGSALGIGMAENLHAVPAWAAGIAALVLTGGFFLRQRARGPEGAGLLFALALAALLLPATASADAPDPGRRQLALGRQVYIDEGCVYCHSQYIRPGTDDVVKWGPAAPLFRRLAEIPPLFGNRRQGPDLSEIGLRRTGEWNRVHLEHPREVSPGSRMPSYDYLFRPGDPRGPALVAYLESLGQDDWAARAQQVQAWKPAADAPILPPAEQARLFGRLCAQCHGREGRGDGPLARRLKTPPANLHEPWKRVDPADEAGSLARIIKFGVPGTPMAGHESLTDSEIVSLVAFVETLHHP